MRTSKNSVGKMLRGALPRQPLLVAFSDVTPTANAGHLARGQGISFDAAIGTSANEVLDAAGQYATSLSASLNSGCLAFTLLQDTAIRGKLLSAGAQSGQLDEMLSEAMNLMNSRSAVPVAAPPSANRVTPGYTQPAVAAAADTPPAVPPTVRPVVQTRAPAPAPAPSPTPAPANANANLSAADEAAAEEREADFDKSALFIYGRNLTKLAREGKLRPTIGRRKEIRRSVEILGRQTKSNPVLIGEPGVGKTSIAEGLAMVLAGPDVPLALQYTRLIELPICNLVAGASVQGEFEKRLKAAIEEASNNPVDFAPLPGIEQIDFQKWRVDASIRVSNFNRSLKATIAGKMMGTVASTLSAVLNGQPQVGAIVELCGFLFTVLEMKNGRTISSVEVVKQHTVLFIDEVHTLIGAGGSGGSPLDSANILKPPLARGEVSLLSATTNDEYKKHLRKDAAFRRRLQPIMVEEPSIAETVEIIQGLRPKMEKHYRDQIKITDQAIEAAAFLSARYITDRFLPDKAIDLVDEAASAAAMTMAEAAGEIVSSEVGKAEIESVVHKITGVPLGEMREGEAAKLLDMESILHQQVIGQHAAITAVARAVRRARAGLKDPNRPIGSFLFLGPTGVGKTELAKALQQFLFNNGNLIRLDMSEYQERHTVARLIGAPPGYVGFSEGGQLTEKVRRQPYSVVLLDEIEKAHEDVFNVLLQVMDDGRLTDGQGNTVDFKNVILIMTSNVGGQTLMHMPLEAFTAGGDVPKPVEQELRYTFPPEFLNRIDRVVTFHRLVREHLDMIIEKLLGGLRSLLVPRKLTLTLTQGAKDIILKNGWNEEYGARPLKRTLDQMLTDEISDLILQGKTPDGSEVVVDLSESLELVFSVKDPISMPIPAAEAIAA